MARGRFRQSWRSVFVGLTLVAVSLGAAPRPASTPGPQTPEPPDVVIARELADILGLSGPPTQDGVNELVRIVHSADRSFPNRTDFLMIPAPLGKVRNFEEDAVLRLRAIPEFVRRVEAGARYRHTQENHAIPEPLRRLLDLMNRNLYRDLAASWEKEFGAPPSEAPRMSVAQAHLTAKAQIRTIHPNLRDEDFEISPHREELHLRASRLENGTDDLARGNRARRPPAPPRAQVGAWIDKQTPILDAHVKSIMKLAVESGYAQLKGIGTYSPSLPQDQLDAVLATGITATSRLRSKPPDWKRNLNVFTTLELPAALQIQGQSMKYLRLDAYGSGSYPDPTVALEAGSAEFGRLIFERAFRDFSQALEDMNALFDHLTTPETLIREIRHDAKPLLFSETARHPASPAYEDLSNYIYWAESVDPGHWKKLRASLQKQGRPPFSFTQLADRLRWGGSRGEEEGSPRGTLSSASDRHDDNVPKESLDARGREVHYWIERPGARGDLFMRHPDLERAETGFTETVNLALADAHRPPTASTSSSAPTHSSAGSFVQIATQEPILPRENWLPLAAPAGYEPTRVQVVNSNGVQLDPRTYAVRRHPTTGQLGIRLVDRPGGRPGDAYHLTAEFRPLPTPKSHLAEPAPAWQRLALPRLREVIAELERGGLRELAQDLRWKIEGYPSHRGYLTLREAAAVFRNAAHYSYRSVQDLAGPAAGVEARGPFAEFAKFLNSDGRLCLQCNPMKGLFNRFLSEYYGDDPRVRIFADRGYQVSDHRSTATSADLHVRTLVVGPGAESLVLDATPWERDGSLAPEPPSLQATKPAWLDRLQAEAIAIAPLDPQNLDRDLARERARLLSLERTRLRDGLTTALTELDRTLQTRKARPKTQGDPSEPLARIRQIHRVLQELLEGKVSPEQGLGHLQARGIPLGGHEQADPLSRLLSAIRGYATQQEALIQRLQNPRDPMGRSARARPYQDLVVRTALEAAYRQARDVATVIHADLLPRETGPCLRQALKAISPERS